MGDNFRLEPTIPALQNVQARLERERGANSENVREDERETLTRLALAHEIEQLADVLTRTAGAMRLSADSSTHMRDAGPQIGEVLACLFSVTTLLGMDLGEVYLTAVSDNCFRYPPRSVGTPCGRLLTIAGPSGSGKTTVARSLSREYATFIEDVSKNPHLEALRSGAPFDAYANQRWFLDQMGAFLRAARTDVPIVLDQDPAAIVRVYARMFHDEQRISGAQYRTLLLDLLRVESMLTRRNTRRAVVFLDAPAAVLRERAELRGDASVPPESWFDSVRHYFRELQSRVPAAPVIPTDELSSDEVVKTIRHILDATYYPPPAQGT